ncbi:MFS transporter [Streptomyces sp. NPDC002536]
MSEPALGQRQRRLVLVVCCGALLPLGIDITALNVALPAMERELGATISGMQWVLDAYSLAMAALMLLAGSVGDRVGRRLVMQAGFAVFTTGSVLCALAPTLESLVASRVLQGVGAASLSPVSMSIVAQVFPGRTERTRAMGVWMCAYGLGLAVGPLLGGVLVDTVGWRPLFWLNLPLGLVGMVLTARSVPESRAARPRRLDVTGQLLVIVFLGALTYTVIEAPHRGWTAPAVLAGAATAVAALAALLAWERRCPEPLIELDLFRDLRFSGAIVAGMCVFGTFGGFFFLTSLYLQHPLGLSALQAGLWMLPPSVVLGICSPLAGRLAERYGTRLLLVPAGLALTASAVMLAVLSTDASRIPIFIEYVLFGLGVGLAAPLLVSTAVSGMPDDRAGFAAGLFTTAGRAGFALGVALLGAVLAAGLDNRPLRDAAAFAEAVRPAWCLVAAGGLAVALLGLLITARRPGFPDDLSGGSSLVGAVRPVRGAGNCAISHRRPAVDAPPQGSGAKPRERRLRVRRGWSRSSPRP